MGTGSASQWAQTRREADVTRENKLALILAFSLILLIGVLVSDHLSKAGRVHLDGLESVPRPGVLEPAVVLDERLDEAVASAVDAPASLADALAPSDPVTVHEPGTELASASTPTPEEPVEIVQGDRPRADSAALIARARELGVELLPADRVLAQTRSVPQAASQPPAASHPAPTPELVLYTVRDGETLYRLAERLLGDPNRWRELRDLNRDTVSAEGSIRAGQRLRVPASAGIAAAAQAAASERSARTYVVKQNDTLGEIAAAQLGTVRRMGEIVALNRGQIDDADDIRAGMTLKLPAK